MRLDEQKCVSSKRSKVMDNKNEDVGIELRVNDKCIVIIKAVKVNG
jgi:hypothetical protein